MIAKDLTKRDAQVHRCTCGSWLYAKRPCTTCARRGGIQ